MIASKNFCIPSHMAYPFGLMIMQPLTGAYSASSPRRQTCWYHSATSSDFFTVMPMFSSCFFEFFLVVVGSFAIVHIKTHFVYKIICKILSQIFLIPLNIPSDEIPQKMLILIIQLA